ncbi:MAG: hypothetical protein GYA17_21925, partial [Chloroflexi bacterium]|nr:hypothetical protein [Chloroflexota bacterium]
MQLSKLFTTCLWIVVCTLSLVLLGLILGVAYLTLASSRSVQAAQGGSQLAILPALAPATRTPFQPLPTSTVTQTPT